MSNPKKSSEHNNQNLKGTLYATFGVGLVIIIVWVFCFDLFIGRF